MPTCAKVCGTKLSYQQIHTLLRKAGCPEAQIVLMGAIAGQESGGCTDIIGCISPNEWSVGVFQINTRVHKKFTIEQLKNPTNNASEAVRILKSQGLKAWGAYTDGNYKKFLSASQKAYNGQNVPVGNITTNTGNTQVVPNNQNNQNQNPSNQQQDQSGINPYYALGFLLLLAVL